MKKLIFLFVICLYLGSCSSRVMGVSLISTEPVNIEPHTNLYKYPHQKVTGSDSAFMFIVPTRIPRIKHAVKDALEKANANLLINATIYTHYWWFIIGRYTIEVKGTAVQVPEGKKK